MYNFNLDDNDFLELTDEELTAELDDILGDYLDDEVIKKLSNENKVKKMGYNCKKCNEWYEYAEANQKDGTFKCYGCRIF